MMFLKVYGDTIRYCFSWKKFLIWNGTCWEVDNDGVVEQMVSDFSPKMYRAELFMDNDEMRTEFEKHLLRFESYPRMMYLYNLLKSAKEISVKSTELDLDKYLFNAEKQTINLKTGENHVPEQKDFLTKKSLFVYYKDAKCPTCEIFLMQIFNNDLDLIHFVQKAFGYTLSEDISEQCMFILFGSGAEENKPMSESLIKQITGGDKITARFLYGEYFDFLPTFKIFMATNHKPKISGGDNGIWRRIKLIPFSVSIPAEKRDRHLTEKLMAENSGILNWLLEGYHMLEREGLQGPEAVREDNDEYRFDMDIVQNFITECLDIDASLNERLLNAELYDTFTKWCEKSNETILSQRKFTSKMKEKNYEQFPSNSSRWWLGPSVKKEWKA